MIAADARTRFTAEDVTLLEDALVATASLLHDSAADVLNRLGVDDILDDANVTTFLIGCPVPGPSPSLLFYVLARQALRNHGIDDRRVADYCAALMREFGLRRRAQRITSIDDQEHGTMVEIMEDLHRSGGPRRFRIMVHLGEYALWLAGLFPDRIEAQRTRRGGPTLTYYDALGYRGYAAASDHALADRSGLADVYRLTAEQFPVVRRSLTAVKNRLALRAA